MCAVAEPMLSAQGGPENWAWDPGLWGLLTPTPVPSQGSALCRRPATEVPGNEQWMSTGKVDSAPRRRAMRADTTRRWSRGSLGPIGETLSHPFAASLIDRSN